MNQTLTFNSSFSCTILTSAKTAPNSNGYTINYPSDNFAALFISGANNIISLNVSYSHAITPTSPLCKGTAMNGEYSVVSNVCPAVLVLKSYGIQIGKVGGSMTSGSGWGARCQAAGSSRATHWQAVTDSQWWPVHGGRNERGRRQSHFPHRRQEAGTLSVPLLPCTLLCWPPGLTACQSPCMRECRATFLAA